MKCQFVSIQGTYNKIELALFRADVCCQVISKIDVKASSLLVPLLDSLLQENKITLQDLAFIAVDKGPGAFTSLRVTISTVNGIAFASGVPLIGVSGLDALAHQVSSLVLPDEKRLSLVVCLLNAYNNDVYFLLVSENEPSVMGCKKIDELLAELAGKFSDYNLWFAGNAAELHQELIKNFFSQEKHHFSHLNLCSAESIGRLAYKQWLVDHKTENQITPLYVKTQVFAVKSKPSS